MKVRSTVKYPIDTPTLSGNIYSYDALKNAFADTKFTKMNHTNAIPVFYTTDGIDRYPIGSASATLYDSSVVKVDAEIYDLDLNNILMNNKYSTTIAPGILLSGKCSKTIDGVISNIDYNECVLTMFPEIPCSMEIIEEL